MAASVPRGARKRWALRCGICATYVALADRPLPDSASVLCRECVSTVDRLEDEFEALVAQVTDGPEALDGDRPDRVTAEGAYEQARHDERVMEAEPDGELRRARPGRRDWPS